MSYYVKDKEFATFEEVVKWAWDEHKIDVGTDMPVTIEKKDQACQDLEDMIEESRCRHCGHQDSDGSGVCDKCFRKYYRSQS